MEEAQSEDSGQNLLISLAEVAELLKKLLCSKGPGVDKFLPQMLKA